MSEDSWSAMQLKLAVWSALLLAVRAEQTCDYARYGVVPDVVATAPSVQLDVTFSSGEAAHCGNELSPESTLSPPKVQAPVDPAPFYTLLHVNPDAPLVAPYLHWLEVDIPGSGLRQGDISAGSTEATYRPPQPFPGAGPQRYVYLVYRQPARSAGDSLATDEETELRYFFNVTGYAASRRLEGPVAGNFFLEQLG
ncbi:26 kDa secreted antigen-like [Bacillus rossius redtenbacheri]|uniref:26 kDa secreted antigen-like n=1 Tax=Bacillus rossius redtenbacheri TaxID=93214 RepID=UPI002FDDA1C6